MSVSVDRLLPGRPFPLGATSEIDGVNFAVFSAHAEKIELCLFDAAGRQETARYELPECTDEVFHGFLPNGRPGQIYGFRAHGPYAPELGHRFNPNKLLLDPYARQLSGELRWSDALFGFLQGSKGADLSFDPRDSAAFVPKAMVAEPERIWKGGRSPDTPWPQTIIYEAHTRGLTWRHPEIPAVQRGTFAALAHPSIIDHLVTLGITAIELLPVHAILQDRFLVGRRLRNYWGYNTLSFFAPEPSYHGAGGANELRIAIQRLHSAGIEVILDVVYNHTCESDEMGPTLSWRGLDNASYYRAVPGRERYPVNDTGTGNTLNLSHPRVLQMVLDSLRYWATSFHVDGFRFDLCSTLGRGDAGFDPGSAFFDAILQDPVLSRLKLIAEPWDIGPGGYQLGNHPPGFSEWNDRFRDAARRFVRGDAGMRGEMAARLAGSWDIFGKRRRKSWASVNFVAAHDGYPLQDAVSFTRRYNEANGEGNKDGQADNYSANWGIEGHSDDPAIIAQRERVKRMLLMLLFLAHGTPMLLAGDEMGRTQRGNNNAYCQDNEISWIDWTAAARAPNADLYRFASGLTAVRRQWTALQSGAFMHGIAQPVPGIPDMSWFDECGQKLTQEDWHNSEARLLVLRRAAHRNNDPRERVEVTLLLMNATAEDRDFILPEPVVAWQLITNSAAPDARQPPVAGPLLTVSHHSAVLLAALLEIRP